MELTVDLPMLSSATTLESSVEFSAPVAVDVD